MKNRILTNIWGIGLGFLIAGLLWGFLRIEFTLLVPYYFMVAIFVDLGVYLLIGIIIGRNVRTYHETRSWLILLLLALFYISDRFLASRLLLNLPYAFNMPPQWILPSEILVISTGILSSVFGWKKARPG